MNKLTCISLGIALSSFSLAAYAQTPKVVISQVYGGAGCGTAGCSTYKNDFIELFNSGNAAQNLNGWSVQYIAATGMSTWQVTNLTNITLQPGQYYLIAESAGANGINNLPTPDVTGIIAMSATAAKVALLSTTTPLTGGCPLTAVPANTSIVDFIGYGVTASCSEGGVNAPSPSTTTADFRAASGCTDANNNATDFSAATPAPRNTATATAPCMILPVSFLSFNAQYQEGARSVLLRWSTAQERNAWEFTVERSTDGKAWIPVQHVAATGTTSAVTAYQATDSQVQPGTTLYRIRQQDLDGQSQYTAVARVTASGMHASLYVFPNPTTGTVAVTTALSASATAGISVADLSGRVVFQEQRMVDAQPLSLDLSRLEKGTYFLTVSSGAFLKTEKVFLY